MTFVSACDLAFGSLFRGELCKKHTLPNLLILVVSGRSVNERAIWQEVYLNCSVCLLKEPFFSLQQFPKYWTSQSSDNQLVIFQCLINGHTVSCVCVILSNNKYTLG